MNEDWSMSQHSASKRPQKKLVLFFGRDGCKNSEKLVALLQQLGFEVTAEFVKSRKHRLSERCFQWSGDFIFSYRCLVKIPLAIIQNASLDCVNFHPATPQHRGSGGINWALYNNENEFGVTVHRMNGQIDAGEILLVDRFDISDRDNLESLWRKTDSRMYEVAHTFFHRLACQGQTMINNLLQQNQSEKWSGRLHRIEEVDSLEKLSLDCGSQELERVIRSTVIGDRVPYVCLHRHRFNLVMDE